MPGMLMGDAPVRTSHRGAPGVPPATGRAPAPRGSLGRRDRARGTRPRRPSRPPQVSPDSQAAACGVRASAQPWRFGEFFEAVCPPLPFELKQWLGGFVLAGLDVADDGDRNGEIAKADGVDEPVELIASWGVGMKVGV